MSFTNLYYKRAAGTPRACYVCFKPTTTVLATINTADFIYVCDTHLTDPGFATQFSDNAAASVTKKPSPSPEEIAKVKEEWEERQKRKQERAKEKEKEQDKDGKDKDEGKNKDKESKKDNETKKSTPPPSKPSPSSSSSTSTTPTHVRYQLHRDIFSMRQAEHRRRKQTVQAQALAPKLPGAPKTSLPSS